LLWENGGDNNKTGFGFGFLNISSSKFISSCSFVRIFRFNNDQFYGYNNL